MYTKLISDIEKAMVRLQSNHGNSLTILVGKIVSPAAHKNGLTRTDTNHTEKVFLSELNHVSVHESKTNGLCIRLVFDGRLFAVSGQDADKLELWAEKASKLKAHQIIDEFPDMRFHAVPGKVKIEGAGQEQEIIMAYA